MDGTRLQLSTGNAPYAWPCFSLSKARDIHPQVFILAMEEVLPMLLRAACDPSYDYSSPCGQLWPLPQFPQWLML